MASADSPPPDFRKSLHLYFSKSVNFIDNNIRIIQFSLYSVGVFGCIYTLHSIRAFTKFKFIKDVPKEFITKNMRFRGTVISASQRSLTRLDTKPVNLSTDPCINHNEENSSHIDNKPTQETDDKPLPVYLQMSHIPVFNISRSSSTETLMVNITGVEVQSKNLKEIEECLVGKITWFKIIDLNDGEQFFHTIIKQRNKYFGNYNRSLIQAGLANVAAFDTQMKNNKEYIKLYQNLLRDQERKDKIKFRFLRYIIKKFRTK